MSSLEGQLGVVRNINDMERLFLSMYFVRVDRSIDLHHDQSPRNWTIEDVR
jgi:hypothetical protein